MDYRRLGKSGLKVSRLWLGGMSLGDAAIRPWVINEAASGNLIARAIEHGINTIDTCDVYSNGFSEEIIGNIVRERGQRDRLVIATKFGWPFSREASVNESGYSRRYIIQACESSLRRLKTDYIDLYQTHIWDESTNIEEMVGALDRLVYDGKVRYVGATDMPAWQFAKAVYTAKTAGLTPFISMQHHYNAVWREDERELIPFCRDEGLGLVSYSPLARGFLCGSDRATSRAKTDDRIDAWYGRDADKKLSARIADIAKDIGCSSATVALAWVFATPGVMAAVVGPVSAAQLDDLAAGLGAHVSTAQLESINELYVVRPRQRHG